MEIIKEHTITKVDCECPSCKLGYLRPTGIAYPTYPIGYLHRCTNCDYKETFLGKIYPYIQYE